MAVNRIVRNKMAILVGILSISATDIPKSATLGPTFSEITFAKGYSKPGFTSGRSQVYVKAYNHTCNNVMHVASFSAFSGSEKKVFFRSEQNTIIYGATIFASGTLLGPTSISQSACRNKISFTPKPSGRYRIMQIAESAGSCHFEIVDLETGQEPVGVEHMEFTPCVKEAKTALPGN